MEQIFNTIAKKIYLSNNHHGYIVKYNLISPICKKWSRNRDHDEQRVLEMTEFYNNGGYIPAILHVAESVDEGLVCYDGNHRRMMFDKINSENITCIVDIIFNASQKDIYNSFQNLNKSVQVPIMFLTDDDEKIVKDDILKLVKEYEKNYKPFLSTSSRCHAPNFNRDMFIDEIYNIYKKYDGVYTVEYIGKALIKLNSKYAKNIICKPHCSYSKSLIDKCSKHNFFLFLDKNINLDHLEIVLRDLP